MSASKTRGGVRWRRSGGPRCSWIAFLALAISLAPEVAGAWGGRIHEIVNRAAVSRMPEPARSAWEPLAVKLGAHASDADHRKSTHPGERPRHFIDIDFYDEHPFKNVSRDYDELVRKHGRETVQRWGVVPWAIEECYRMLVLSLERGDWSSAGAWAADLGHYVADSHQPLHCTMNYDGQKSGNDGIHLRFEVHMMNRHFEEETITTAELRDPGDDVLEFCFSWIAEAYPGLHPILEADDHARGIDAHYGDRYYEALWNETSALATQQVSRAVQDLAALYLAAWEEAGSPAGPPQTPIFLALRPEDLEPSEEASRGRDRGAWIVAGTVLIGAFLLGAGS